MPLAGLILAQDDDETGFFPLVTTLAGQSVLEHHARLLASLGAGHIVLLAERMPAALVAALDRLKSGGIDVEVVRNAADAADSIHPDERLMVVSGPVLAPKTLLADMFNAAEPQILTVPDSAGDRFERIDRADRWSGIACVTGQLLRQTTAIIGDWQLGPTLLRLAVQTETQRMAVPELAMLALVHCAGDVKAANRALASAALPGPGDIADRHLVAPLAQRLAQTMTSAEVSVSVLVYLTITLITMSFILAYVLMPTAAMVAFFVASLPMALADIFAEIGHRKVPLLERLHQLREFAFAALLLGCAVTTGLQPLNPVLLIIAASVVVMQILTGDLAKRLQKAPAWRPGATLFALVLVVPFAINQMVFGLMLLLAVLLTTQFLHQRSISVA